MFKRINTGLFNPTEIKNFIKDKIWYVLLYILFLSILASIPVFIELAVVKDVDPRLQNSVVTKIQSKKLEGNIEDYKYVGEEIPLVNFNEQFFIGALTNDYQRLGFVFLFNEDKLNVYAGGVLYKEYTYEELKLETFDFQLDKKADRNSLGEAINIIFKDNKALYNTSLSFIAVGNSFVSGLFLILMLTLLTAFSMPKIVYRYRFIMASYASTAYFLAHLLERLFAIDSLNIIGVVFAIIAVRKAHAGFFKLVINVRRKEDEDE